jgi:hypothetical protein
MRKNLMLLGLAVALASCAPSRLYMNVQASMDPEVPITPGATFATVTGSMKDDLLERELLAMVKERLVAKGLRFQPEHPDLYVAVSGYLGSEDRYIPPQTIYIPTPTTATQATSFSGGVGAVPVYGTATTTASGTSYLPITRPGRTRTEYLRRLDVLVARPVAVNGKVAAQSIWQGQVSSGGATGDLALVAPALLDELLTEFPRRSGRPAQRTVNWRP